MLYSRAVDLDSLTRYLVISVVKPFVKFLNRHMSISNFSRVAKEVSSALSGTPRLATEDRDAEWQRVNSYIADVLKDAHVLYAKLARLQGDFAGPELDSLEKISENVLSIGGSLSAFSKSFYEGKVGMAESSQYGEDEVSGGEGADVPSVPDFEAPEEPSEGEPDLDIEFDYEEGGGEEDEEKEKEELFTCKFGYVE